MWDVINLAAVIAAIIGIGELLTECAQRSRRRAMFNCKFTLRK